MAEPGQLIVKAEVRKNPKMASHHVSYTMKTEGVDTKDLSGVPKENWSKYYYGVREMTLVGENCKYILDENAINPECTMLKLFTKRKHAERWADIDMMMYVSKDADSIFDIPGKPVTPKDKGQPLSE